VFEEIVRRRSEGHGRKCLSSGGGKHVLRHSDAPDKPLELYDL
jgi:hypothetical protein